MQEVM